MTIGKGHTAAETVERCFAAVVHLGRLTADRIAACQNGLPLSFGKDISRDSYDEKIARYTEDSSVV